MKSPSRKSPAQISSETSIASSVSLIKVWGFPELNFTKLAGATFKLTAKSLQSFKYYINNDFAMHISNLYDKELE